MKKLMLIVSIMLVSIISQSQIEYLGHHISDVQYDDGEFHNDTLVVFDSDTTCSNFITENDTITSILRVLPISQLEIILVGFSTMEEHGSYWYFEYDVGLYRAAIIYLDDNDYFAIYLERIE